ncbi:hypothetical protein P872_00200 [Rhodonellum psychrophilum GCM71 = DSM 17998]|uniref:PorZ N-terminal beta-propeller domain-containing protein n=2 Tax=Rhodonellum TaxID=336827 RepID=U5C3N6_9BACT|nr:MULTISPECIES: T9SS type A sorting domain-containing protein [Rhodonellum]ERM83531.1 hypothetical protein P872_00200 [Rhodonellum psychrophilum GCM71 = DSM 17998]SDY52252.1 Por secretion system C-terminal sorting domain-containing protein [Rhodonellum ikkaensis]
MGGGIRGLQMESTTRNIFFQRMIPVSFDWTGQRKIDMISGNPKKRLFLKSVGLFLLLIVFSVFPPNANLMAQSDIPVGSWRFHQSYLDAGFLKGDDRTVFYHAAEAISFFATHDLSPRAITKMDGLYGQAFTAAAYDSKSKLFMVSYPDGTLDVIGEKSIKSVYDLKDNAQILNKRIRGIKIFESSAFLMADFGLAQVDLMNGQFLDAFLNIGPEGSNLPIFDMSMDEKSIYLATELGILKGEKSKNLKDFRNWELLARSVDGGFHSIEELGGKFFMRGADLQLYLLQEDEAELIFGTYGSHMLKKFGSGLFFVQEGTINKLTANGSFSGFYESDNMAFTDYHVVSDDLYLSVPGKGIFKTGDNKFIFASGPQTKIQKFIWTVSGVFAIPYFVDAQGNSAASERNAASKLVEGIWEKVEVPKNTTEMVSIQDVRYFGTDGDGLWKEQNGTLEKLNLPGNNGGSKVWALAKDAQNQLWVGFGDNQERLVKIKTNGDWETIPVPGLQFAFKIRMDKANNLWILQTPAGGSPRIRVFNASSGLNRLLGNADNQGAFPPGQLLDMDIDQADNLWLGMSSGVVYLPAVSGTNTNSGINAIQPLFENRNLLNGQSVTSVKVAPDQTKWFGTSSNGLWHFNEFGNGLLAHFTRDNSPLPSNTIRNLTLDPLTGALLMVVPNGALSFRGGSMKAFESLEALKIYPNPVRPDFVGYLSIEGLTDFAFIKISNASGRVVYSAQVRGGKTTWNLRNGEGGKLSPGVYLVYTRDEGGSESVSGKFVVL